MLLIIFSEGGFVDADDGGEELNIDEEGGGWDVDDDDLELPADLVRCIDVQFIIPPPEL